MLEIEKVSFQIQGVELVESSFKVPANRPISEKEVFKFNLNLEHLLDPGKEILIVKTHVNILVEDSEEAVGVIKSQVIFKVLDLVSYFQESKLNLPDIFISTLNSISISTTRGMMFSAFRGTFLHNAILPLIDPAFKEEDKDLN
ncbi:hypothetical protein PBAC_29130 [Pedobacter glucosidilyticus]|uniref:Preprotein translocase subunit SecB n=1 Tax=Pedobacter aquae TaxID=2605747 RepID=A0A5C0VJZ5_9SPHI|nr:MULTISPECIES: hypothetical protein [Pedobacter]KHJ36878.1 hypothetical protein PBAC_29130 [Pedobacter glucosidilyticus]QEK52073.1 hypothetical protein FYC62_10705 [Pedobacter aquae]